MNIFSRTFRIVASAIVLLLFSPLISAQGLPSPSPSPTSTSVQVSRAVPANTKAPVVSGTLRVPNRLSVTNGTWSGVPTSFSYQWLRCTTKVAKAAATKPAQCTDISGATTSAYTLTDDDAGKFISARVGGSNTSGGKVIFTPAATAVVTRVIAPQNTVVPTVSGTAEVSRVLTVTNGTWIESPDEYAYQWYRCTKAVAKAVAAKPSTCSVISGATQNTYQLESADSKKFLTATVTASNASGSGLSGFVKSTAAIAVPSNSAPAVFVSPGMFFESDGSGAAESAISGTVMLGSVLVASKGQWLGYPLPEVSYSYWYRCDVPHATAPSSRPTDCYAIPGSNGTNGETYLVTADDVGKYLAFEVIATNISGTSRFFTASTDTVEAKPTLISAPVLTGMPRFGQTLSVTQGRWSVAPGLALLYSYEWFRCSTSTPSVIAGLPTGCTSIGGQVAPTYSLTAADLGSYVVASVIVTNPFDESVSAASNVTLQVLSSPTVVTAPTVSGTRVTGSDLSVSAGSWTVYPAADSTYQWYRCTSAVSSAVTVLPSQCSVIVGATSSTYSLVDDDGGKFVTVASSKSNDVGSLTVWSVGSLVTNRAPVNTVAPVLSGNGRYHTSLSVSTGTWVGFPAPTFAYAWYRCATDSPTITGGVPVGCTTLVHSSASYTVAVADLGSFVFASVTATNSISVVKATATTVGMSQSPPMYPGGYSHTVSGYRGVGSVLSLTEGEWVSFPAVDSTTYQWYRCASALSFNPFVYNSNLPSVVIPKETLDILKCSVIIGATSSTYTLVADDNHYLVTVATSGSNSLGSAVVLAGADNRTFYPLGNTSVPVLSGNARLNSTLTVSTGSWTGDTPTTFTYKWYRCATDSPTITGGVPVGCTTLVGSSASYTVAVADLGSFVFASVTATNSVSVVKATATTVGISQSSPTVVTDPTVSGTSVVGYDLSVSAGSWTIFPAADSTYQWYRCTSAVSSAVTVLPSQCSVIFGATSSTYSLVADDAGKFVTVSSSKSNDLGSLTVWSRTLNVYSPSPPTVVTAPTVASNDPFGSFAVGSILSVSPGSWDLQPAAVSTYQWYRCTSAVSAWVTVLPSQCSAILTAVSSSRYIVVLDDVGKYVTVATSKSNGVGSLTVWSAATRRTIG